MHDEISFFALFLQIHEDVYPVVTTIVSPKMRLNCNQQLKDLKKKEKEKEKRKEGGASLQSCDT